MSLSFLNRHVCMFCLLLLFHLYLFSSFSRSLSIYLSISFFMYVFDILKTVFVLYLFVFVCLLSVCLSIYSSIFVILKSVFVLYLLCLSVSYFCLFPRCQAACQSNSCAKIRHDLSLHMQATIIFLFQISSKIILF